MKYVAFVSREGRHLLAEFPDCPGCQTFADSGDELPSAAKDALEGWLEAHLVDGQAPPEPKAHKRAPSGHRLAPIEVDPALAVALQIRWARARQNLSQTELAKRAGVSQQQIAKLERPGENPSVGTMQKIATALGLSLDIAIR